MKFYSYINDIVNKIDELAMQVPNEKWKYYVDDDYLTLDISKSKLKELFNDFIYGLPKKYSTKKNILANIRKDKIRVSPKEFNAYVDGLDESRLEELVGFIYKSIDKWGGV